MKTLQITSYLLASSVLLVGVFTSLTSAQETTTVELDVLSGTVNISSTGNFDFGDYVVTSSIQTVTGAFVGSDWYFFVDDQEWDDAGYYTTVQMQGPLLWPGGKTIDPSNIYMQVTSGTGAVLLSGQANPRVEIDATMSSRQSLNFAKTLIKRDAASNFGIVGKYGVLPEMRVDIPAYQAVGNYSATMVFTLFDN